MADMEKPAGNRVAGEARGVCRQVFENAGDADLEGLVDAAWLMLGDQVFDQVGEDAIRAYFLDLIAAC